MRFVDSVPINSNECPMVQAPIAQLDLLKFYLLVVDLSSSCSIHKSHIPSWHPLLVPLRGPLLLPCVLCLCILRWNSSRYRLLHRRRHIALITVTHSATQHAVPPLLALAKTLGSQSSIGASTAASTGAAAPSAQVVVEVCAGILH
jgi:hypothetical protein